MEIPWSLFPLLLQLVYTSSAVPPLLRLREAKRSDQHATANQWLTLGAHAAMIGWALAYARQPGLVASYLVGIATTGVTLATILHYRAHPGGRAARPRRAPSRPVVHRASEHALVPGARVSMVA